MKLHEAYTFTRNLEHYNPYGGDWVVIRIERLQMAFDEWGILLYQPKQGQYARTSDPFALEQWPYRITLLPNIEPEKWPD